MKRKLLSALCIVIFAIATVAMTACTPLKHTVTFVNYDGTQLYSVVVDHNAIPAYEGEAPVRAEDNLYVYEFNGWLDSEGTYYESRPVTGADVTYTASYALTAKYLAVFVNGSEVLQSETLYEGDAVVYKGATPVKAVDEQYTYTFAGWTEGGVEYPVGSELPAISGHVTYHAYFSATDNYRINFVNGEQTLQSSLLAEGSAIAYEGETPVKEPDTQYRYEFAGWSLTEGGEIVDIATTATESLTYYAVFNSFARVYVVNFVGANGETLFSQEMNYGEVPAYNGETPVKESDVYYHYTFSGWDKEIGAVEGDITYTAQFSATLREYKVVWSVEGVETSATFKAGEEILYAGATPVKADDANYRYTFAGWALSEGGDAVEPGLALADVKFYALFSAQKLYTVTFTDETGKVLETQKLLEGECATFAGQIPVKENTAQYTYEYIGWIVDGVSYSFEDLLPEVYEDVTYVLELKTTVNEYEIVWNVDGNLTKKDFAYGVVPTFNGTPEKAATAQYTYTFVGWSTSENGTVIEVPAVSGPATYYAVFTATVNKYTVTFLGEDGAKLQSHVLEYGAQIVFEGELPTLARTQQYTYYPAWKVGEEVIDLRTGTLPEIVADVTYEFVNIAEVNQYTITINYAVSTGAVAAPTSKSFTVDYGTAYGEAETASPAVKGFAPDRYWLAGIVFDDATYTVNYTPVTVWDGSTGTSFESGSGTASDPYIIKTGAQLAYLGKLGADATSAKGSVYGTGIYYKLGASIDLSGYQWTPICFRDTTSTYNWTYFDGNFDGAGHTIIMNISNTGFGYGLFQGVGAKSVVKNLTIAGKVSVKHRAGAIAYISLAGAAIDNVHNYADILASNTGEIWVGGFLGSSTKTTITNSTNYGKVVGGTTTGGFCGSGSGTVITNCVNYGDVSNNTGCQKVAGFIGNASGSTKITSCVNYGKITGTGNYVGGITGMSAGTTVDGCVNYGEIVGGAAYNGGITGTTQSSSKTTNSINYGKVTASGVNTGGISGYLGAGSELYGCTNYGAVSGTEDVGGIIGENQSNPGTATAPNYNYGDVEGTAVNIGGIVGNQYCKDYAHSINYGYNYGTITGPKCVGGIVGLVNKGTVGVVIQNSENHGKVIGTNQYIGGIVGSSATATVKNCKNYGFINAPKANNIAGIVGFATNTTEVILCENHGDIIAGTSSNGAIVGYLGGGATLETASKVVGCVNYGDISGSGTVGGIVGLNNGYVTRYFVEGEAEVKTVNYGNVTATGAYVGGICGNTGISSNCVASMTEYAINYGTITAGKNSDGISSVGGINGQVTNGGSIQNCENHGAVSGTGSQVGGIAGYVNGTVTGCTNDADVYGGGSYVGGIVGENKGTVKDVENSGNVKSYTSYIGGCVGRNNGGTVENATNCGSVTAERAAQKAGTGIGGVIGSNQASATASKLYNYGDVIGYTQVGGVSGYQGAGSSIDTAVNEGDVTGYGDVGQIVGTNNSVDLTTNASGSGVVTDLVP